MSIKLNITRKQWYDFHRRMRKAGHQFFRTEDPLAAKADFATQIATKAEGGIVLLHESGYDCDWTYGEHCHKVRACLTAVEKAIDDIHRWAEGPVSIALLAPSERPERSAQCGRNLVEEAFENGHAHCVHPSY